VGDAAVDQQLQMRRSYVSFANFVSAAAQRENATWPLFRVPDFELLAGQVRLQSGSEAVSCTTLVDMQDEDEYLKFISNNYKDGVDEAHLIRYGNLDRLVPEGYTPNFTLLGMDGFLPDLMKRAYRAPMWQLSPRTYYLRRRLILMSRSFLTFFHISHYCYVLALSSYDLINWDLVSSEPLYLDLINALIALKNESVTSDLDNYGGTGILTEQEHNAMHSALPNSDSSFPHSFLFAPVYKIPGDQESKIVAYIGGGFAWDFALRFLLPDNIQGLVVELRNSCNQSSIYELMGHDAFYLGKNATHEPMYNEMEVVRDLSPSTHPNFATTPGHCRYSMVRCMLNLPTDFVNDSNPKSCFFATG
jgi:hypothetical protein